MKKLLVISMLLTFIGISQSYALYLVAITSNCFEVWTDDPCNGGTFLGTGCTGIIAGNPRNNAELASLVAKSNKAIVVDPKSDLAKLILKADPRADLKRIKVNAIKTELKAPKRE